MGSGLLISLGALIDGSRYIFHVFSFDHLIVLIPEDVPSHFNAPVMFPRSVGLYPYVTRYCICEEARETPLKLPSIVLNSRNAPHTRVKWPTPSMKLGRSKRETPLNLQYK